MRPSLLPAVLLLALALTGCDLFNSHPTTRFDTSGNAWDVFALGDTLFVAERDSGLLALDIAGPRSPREIWRRLQGTDCRSVVARGPYGFVGTDSGVIALDLTGADQLRLGVGGTDPAVTALCLSGDRLYVATAGGVTVHAADTIVPTPIGFFPLAGGPTGMAVHDSRLFVSLRDWGVRVFNVVSEDSLSLDTIHLGRHNRAEGVTVTPGGYCILSQADSGTMVYHSPWLDTLRLYSATGGSHTSAYGSAAYDVGDNVTVWVADSSDVTVQKVTSTSISGESNLAEFEGFTRRLCRKGGYVFTASGEAGVYIIRE